MDKFWAGLIVLALILALALSHASYVEKKINELEAGLELVQKSAAEGDYSSAEEKMRDAMDMWDGFVPYANAFLRGSDVENICTSLQDYFSVIYSQDGQSLRGEYEKLLKTLQLVANSEKPLLENIF